MPMRRPVIIFLLAALLLCQSASAAAGSRADPLITRSYLDETFLPQLRQALTEAAKGGGSDPLLTLTLSAGQGLALRAGEQLLLLSGAARLTALEGENVDAAEGRAFTGAADALPGHRYLWCEGAAGWADVTQDAVIRVSLPARVEEGSPFRDLSRTDWFFSDVTQAYRRGLVNGTPEGDYLPYAPLSLCQCVKLAACMHQLRSQGYVSLQNSPEGIPWYRSYVDYALAQGILTEEGEDYDAAVTRQRFVEIFYRALPESAYTPVNSIPDGAIPDLRLSDPAGPQVYSFYRAGILTGVSDEVHAPNAFAGESGITRAEVATIMNRMFEPEARQRFSL